jgi:hypothetical protein
MQIKSSFDFDPTCFGLIEGGGEGAGVARAIPLCCR